MCMLNFSCNHTVGRMCCREIWVRNQVGTRLFEILITREKICASWHKVARRVSWTGNKATSRTERSEGLSQGRLALLHMAIWLKKESDSVITFPQNNHVSCIVWRNLLYTPKVVRIAGLCLFSHFHIAHWSPFSLSSVSRCAFIMKIHFSCNRATPLLRTILCPQHKKHDICNRKKLATSPRLSAS